MLRLLLNLGYPQEEVRESRLGKAARIAAGLLTWPRPLSAEEAYLIRCAAAYQRSRTDGDQIAAGRWRLL